MRNGAVRLAGAMALCGVTLMPVSAQAFDAGGFAGGILGGMIGSAMMQARRPVVVYRPRPAHVAARAAPPSSGAAVVNASADPFAAAKPTGPTPLPVANKP